MNPASMRLATTLIADRRRDADTDRRRSAAGPVRHPGSSVVARIAAALARLNPAPVRPAEAPPRVA